MDRDRLGEDHDEGGEGAELDDALAHREHDVAAECEHAQGDTRPADEAGAKGGEHLLAHEGPGHVGHVVGPEGIGPVGAGQDEAPAQKAVILKQVEVEPVHQLSDAVEEDDADDQGAERGADPAEHDLGEEAELEVVLFPAEEDESSHHGLGGGNREPEDRHHGHGQGGGHGDREGAAEGHGAHAAIGLDPLLPLQHGPDDHEDRADHGREGEPYHARRHGRAEDIGRVVGPEGPPHQDPCR